MKSAATTVEGYMASLPKDRRSALQSVRAAIRAKLDGKLEEAMQYGVAAYVVPHRVWPAGHHTNPGLPLMYMGFSSQKNDMVVYMLMLLHNTRERAWFDAAWKAAGKRSCLEVTGMGCCLRFKKLDDLSLDVIAEAMRRTPVETYLKNHAETLSRLGSRSSGASPKPRAKIPASKAASKPSKKSLKKPAPHEKPETRAATRKGTRVRPT